MTRKQIWKATSATLGIASMLINTAASAQTYTEPTLTYATTNASVGAQYASILPYKDKISAAKKISLLQAKIRYVFVIFQENRSFDHYFGTYPGANGLVSTYTGANPADPAALPANQTVSYNQTVVDATPFVNSAPVTETIHPFLAPRTIKDASGNTVQLYPESFYSVDHSHNGYIGDLHFQDANLTQAQNDGYALDQEGYEFPTASSSPSTIVKSVGGVYPVTTGVAPTSPPSLASKQKGEVVLAHVDCDTIPFMWHWADVGTLFDNLHQTIIGPSTPNAIAMIAAQAGATQWAQHPTTTGKFTAAQTVPNETDAAPFAGSSSDTFAGKPPYGPDEAGFNSCATTGTVAGTYNNTACAAPIASDPALASYTTSAVVALDGSLAAYASPQLTLTFATLPLSFMGPNIKNITAKDAYPLLDLSDVKDDIKVIASGSTAKTPYDATVIPWGWYQLGFGSEPFDGTRVVDSFPAATPHASYIVHHNGPQYFGYLGDNPTQVAHMHSLSQFYSDIATDSLGARGVFYIRGGYYNLDGLQTNDPSPAVRTVFSGNDDHGSYSDSQISEAMVADTVNAIANSQYWAHSAIIITYDESDGFYDHAPLAVRNWGPDGLPMSGGPRIPTIVLSPYVATHTISHVYSEHGSIVSFINKLFGLKPLSALPNEANTQLAAQSNPALNGPNGQTQPYLGPNDGTAVGDLTEAFDNDRLSNKAALLPASAVIIPTATIKSLPHYGGAGCTTLRITPTDYPNGYTVGGESDPPPQDFNPRPTVSPGIPYLGETILGGVTTGTTASGSNGWTP